MNEKLRTARQQLGLSMINVAAAVGINANTYSRYEKSVAVPNISTAAKIAALFGLPAEYFWDNLRGAQAEEQHELICSACGKHISGSKKAVCKTCAYQGVTVSDSIRKLREVCKTYIGSQSFIGFGEYAKKPRPGVKCNCSSAMIHHEPKATDKGCRNHRYRLSWNLEQWWNWKFKYKLERFICNYIRRPIGRLRKPVPLQWQALNDEPVDFNNNKYYISYNLLLKDFRIFYDDVVKSDEIYFSSKEKAEEALEVFKDELEWYYTEFYRRLDERK